MTSSKRDLEGWSVIQIVPWLPPAISGVGDYATQLATAMWNTCRIPSSIVETRDKREVSEIDLRGQIDALESGHVRKLAILIQYSGYGYDRNGAPSWLVQNLQALLAKYGNLRLLTVFHELYATSPPWRRAFWYSSKQKRVARGLLYLTSGSLCTVARNRKILQRWNRRAPVALCATPSGIGEPSVIPLSQVRARRMVVFGSKALRDRTYCESARKIIQTATLLGIEEVLDVGPGHAEIPRLGGVRIERLGALPSADVSTLMAGSLAGYISYYPGYLAKSSVFAAYCAHGLVPVCPVHAQSEDDGLEPQKHYWVPDGNPDAPLLCNIAANARMWYEQHNIEQHAIWVANSLAALDTATPMSFQEC